MGRGQPHVRRTAPGEGERRRAADRRPGPAACLAEADPGPAPGAARAGHRLYEPLFQRPQGRGAVPGAGGTVYQPEAGRAARRGLPAPALLQGPHARPDVGDVVPDLRAGARAPDNPTGPWRAGDDLDSVQRPAAAGQPPTRPARAAGRRVVSARRQASADARAGRSRLAHALHHELERPAAPSARVMSLGDSMPTSLPPSITST